MKLHALARLAAGLGWAAVFGVEAQTPAAVFDTRAAFMQILTNYTFTTNAVVVTNYVVATNTVVTTNFYNAAGHLLLPVPGNTPVFAPLIPVVQSNAAPTVAPAAVKPAEKLVEKPAEPDPAVVKATQLQAIRELLAQGLTSSSNKVSAPGSFTSNALQQIQVPQGVTSFDRRRSQTLMTAMNLTAEKAAPESIVLLLKTAAQLKTDDPASVIKGDADAATRLLLTAHGEQLGAQLVALVRQAGLEPGLREAYSNVMLRGGGLLGSVLGSGPSLDIESHVAQGLLRAIVTQLTEQERLIRSDASLRKTTALKEAFKP